MRRIRRRMSGSSPLIPGGNICARESIARLSNGSLLGGPTTRPRKRCGKPRTVCLGKLSRKTVLGFQAMPPSLERLIHAYSHSIHKETKQKKKEENRNAKRPMNFSSNLKKGGMLPKSRRRLVEPFQAHLTIGKCSQPDQRFNPDNKYNR